MKVNLLGAELVLFLNTVVSNTIIRNNKATQGAGLEIHQDNGVLLESLLITNNTSDVFYAVGGGIASRQANFIMNNSVIKDNYSTSKGGALYIVIMDPHKY